MLPHCYLRKKSDSILKGKVLIYKGLNKLASVLLCSKHVFKRGKQCP